MNIVSLRDYCLSKHGTDEAFPFGLDTIIYKVGRKLMVRFLPDSLKSG